MVRPTSDHDHDMVASARPPAGSGTSSCAALLDRFRKVVGHPGLVAAAALLGAVLAGPSLLSGPSLPPGSSEPARPATAADKEADALGAARWEGGATRPSGSILVSGRPRLLRLPSDTAD